MNSCVQCFSRSSTASHFWFTFWIFFSL